MYLSLSRSSQHLIQARAECSIPGPAPTLACGFLENTPTSGVSGKPGYIPSAERKGASQGYQASASWTQTFGPFPGLPTPNSPGSAPPSPPTRGFLSFRICAASPPKPLPVARAGGWEQGLPAWAMRVAWSRTTHKGLVGHG